MKISKLSTIHPFPVISKVFKSRATFSLIGNFWKGDSKERGFKEASQFCELLKNSEEKSNSGRVKKK